jgi:hypothetical protein
VVLLNLLKKFQINHKKLTVIYYIYITLREDSIFKNHSACNYCKINSIQGIFLLIKYQYYLADNKSSENKDLKLFFLLPNYIHHQEFS